MVHHLFQEVVVLVHDQVGLLLVPGSRIKHVQNDISEAKWQFLLYELL